MSGYSHAPSWHSISSFVEDWEKIIVLQVVTRHRCRDHQKRQSTTSSFSSQEQATSTSSPSRTNESEAMRRTILLALICSAVTACDAVCLSHHNIIFAMFTKASRRWITEPTSRIQLISPTRPTVPLRPLRHVLLNISCWSKAVNDILVFALTEAVATINGEEVIFVLTEAVATINWSWSMLIWMKRLLRLVRQMDKRINKLLNKLPLILHCITRIDEGLFDCCVLPQQGRNRVTGSGSSGAEWRQRGPTPLVSVRSNRGPSEKPVASWWCSFRHLNGG